MKQKSAVTDIHPHGDWSFSFWHTLFSPIWYSYFLPLNVHIALHLLFRFLEFKDVLLSFLMMVLKNPGTAEDSLGSYHL